MSKYYTPTVAEFHYNFKFEINKGWGPGVPDKWECLLFRPGAEYVNLKKLCAGAVVRVKYLDRKDIEFAGYTHVGGKLLSSALQYYVLKEDNPNSFIQLHHSQNTKSLKIYRSRDLNGVNPMEMLYQGTLNNLAELKKLMAQLGINIKDESY